MSESRKSTLQAFTCEMRPLPPGTKRPPGPRPLRGSEWDIPPILVDILRTGLRRIEALGQSRHPELCASHAEHLQCLPALLVEFDPDVLQRYWNVERVAFTQKITPEESAAFEPLWSALAGVFRTIEEERARDRELGRRPVRR